MKCGQRIIINFNKTPDLIIQNDTLVFGMGSVIETISKKSCHTPGG